MEKNIKRGIYQLARFALFEIELRKMK